MVFDESDAWLSKSQSAPAIVQGVVELKTGEPLQMVGVTRPDGSPVILVVPRVSRMADKMEGKPA